MNPRSIETIFVGYDSIDRGIYHLWNTTTDKLIRSRDVIFFEDKTAPLDSFAKPLNRDSPLQNPAFVTIEQINELQRLLTMNNMLFESHLLPINLRHLLCQYLTPPLVVALPKPIGWMKALPTMKVTFHPVMNREVGIVR